MDVHSAFVLDRGNDTDTQLTSARRHKKNTTQ